MQGELELLGKHGPGRVRRSTVGRRRRDQRQRRRQADRLRDQAVLDAVRGAQGRRRGPVAIDAKLSSRLRRPNPVDGLRVEPALDPGRQLAAAVGVQRDVGDRLRLRRSRARHERAVRPTSELSGGASSATPASSCALARILPSALAIAAGGPRRRARVEAVAHAEPVGVGRDDLDVERRHAELARRPAARTGPPCRRPRWSG